MIRIIANPSRNKKLVSILPLLILFQVWAPASFAQTSFDLIVPYVSPGTITVDGVLDEAAWEQAGTLQFGPTGRTGGYDNELAFGIGGAPQYNDLPVQLFKFLHDGTGSLYVAMQAQDASIQTDTSGDAWHHISMSDGLGWLQILRKGMDPGQGASYTGICLTFYPYAGDQGELTEITASQGHFEGVPRGSTWNWSFLPGNNTVNDPSDTDTGYQIEFVLDITDFQYESTDRDIRTGIQTHDRDGLPLNDPYPWNNTFGWLYQWSNGSYAADYSVNYLRLDYPCESDTTGPGVVAAGPASPLDPETLLVIFDEPLELTTAESPGNYRLNGASVILVARRDEDAPNLVYLTLNPANRLTSSGSYFVQVSNVRDLCGNLIRSDSRNSNLFDFDTLESEASRILNCQLPDGAFAMKHTTSEWLPGQPIWIVPYFAHKAAQGLLDAYQLSPDPDYLIAVRRWIEWYAANMQADGTVTDYVGTYPDYASTGDYDSSDSYAAWYLLTVDRYYQETQDSDFLQEVFPSVVKAVGAMDMTLQSDWLTWGKPDWLIKYTMDNTEVWIGYESAARLASFMEDEREADWRTKSVNVRNAVDTELYLGDTLGRYAIGKGVGGYLHSTWADYYPDGMAQEFVLAYSLPPDSARSERVWQNLLAKFVPDFVPDNGIGYFFTFAAIQKQDRRYQEIGFVSMLRGKRANNYVNEAGDFLHILRMLHEPDLSVPHWHTY